MNLRNNKQLLIHSVLIMFVSLFAVSPAVLGQDVGRYPGPRKPTNTELLAQLGFEATPAGLTQALESPKPFARIYALKVIAEKNDASFLPRAVKLLKHEFVKVQLEAAKVLAQFNRAEGLTWLQSWEKRVGDDPDISDDAAHVVLDAASVLAARGDERLARQVRTCFRHKSWAVKIHAARALGDFGNLKKPELESAWLTAAEITIQELQNDKPVRTDFVKLYLSWLKGSAGKQSSATAQILAKFEELADVKHAETGALRLEIAAEWASRPIADKKTAKPDK